MNQCHFSALGEGGVGGGGWLSPDVRQNTNCCLCFFFVSAFADLTFLPVKKTERCGRVGAVFGGGQGGGVGERGRARERLCKQV